MGEALCEFSVETKSNSVAALNIARIKDVRHLGIALLDPDAFKFHLCEFLDDSHLTLLEAALLQYRPIKCTVKMSNDNLIDKKLIQNVFSRCSVTLLHGGPNDFSEIVDANDIQRLLRDSDQTQFLTDDIQKIQLARQALGCVLKESGVRQDVSLYHQYSLEILSINKFMRLDKAAFSALNIYPQPGERLKSPTSLLGLLNKCRTPFGQSRLISWVTQPSLDINDIVERHDIVQLCVTHSDLRTSLQQTHLRALPNFDQLTTKFHRASLKSISELSLSVCSLDDIFALHEGLVEVHGGLAVLELMVGRSDGSKIAETLEERFLKPLRVALDKLKRFHDLVEYTLDPSEISKGRCLINRTFDPRLQSLAETKDSTWREMEKHRAGVEDDLGLGGKSKGDGQAVKLMECNSYGHVFRVTKKDQRIVQAHPNRYQQVRINKAEYQFVSKKLTILANDYREASEAFEAQQVYLAQKTVSAASTYWPVVQTISDIIGALDILAGFAEVASNTSSQYVRPVMRSSDRPRVIKLNECRHPLVEQQLQSRRFDSTATEFIANSLDMESPERLLNVITGPNMGGKSTFIRQVALSCLMAQIGSFVPCASAEISVVDSILCRVGASDDQLLGVSTFLAEMIEATAITKSATSNSLVLIDELGRGTSTFEGFGLAWEISRYLVSTIKCFTLFATHFHELGDLANEVPGVFNSQVTASIDGNQLVFLFGVKPGCADLSYGVRVAEMAGLDHRVVSKAKTKVEELEAAEARAIGRKRERVEEAIQDVKKVCILLNTVSKEQLMQLCFDEVETFARSLNSTELCI